VDRAREQIAEQQHREYGWIRSRFDLAVAVLLGLTVMAIAWGAYRAELKSKDADHYFNRSDETLTTSHKVELQGDQEVAANEQLFLELVRDQAEGRAAALAFLRRHLLTPQFLAAEAWWRAQPAASRPSSPFVSSNPRYRNRSYAESQRLTAAADDYLDRAHKAENRAIDFTIVTVVLTVALFLFGIATQIGTPAVKLGLVIAGALVLLASFGRFVDLALS
jgi:hypothetical protein